MEGIKHIVSEGFGKPPPPGPHSTLESPEVENMMRRIRRPFITTLEITEDVRHEKEEIGSFRVAATIDGHDLVFYFLVPASVLSLLNLKDTWRDQDSLKSGTLDRKELNTEDLTKLWERWREPIMIQNKRKIKTEQFRKEDKYNALMAWSQQVKDEAQRTLHEAVQEAVDTLLA